jgi:hypothetical protein
MWFVDIIVDLSWFAAAKGKLGPPNSRASQQIPDTDVESTFLLYGDALEVRHLRVLIHTDDCAPPHDIVNANINRWVNLLEVATGLVAAATATTASLARNSTAMMVFLAEGDEHTDSCLLDPQYEPAVHLNYEAAANMMAAWEPDFRVHLFYLGRFLNQQLPPEVRWLNGYRLLEWHFRRGKIGLGKDTGYRDLLDQHGGALDPLLNASQDRKGLIEEVRAMCAHSILSRTQDPRNQDGSTNLINQTFQALESLVMTVMNEGTGGRVSFMPTPQL